MDYIFGQLVRLLFLCILVPLGSLMVITTHLFSCAVDLVNLPVNINDMIGQSIEEANQEPDE